MSKSLRDSNKRGKWWTRLAINLKHLKLKEQSLSVVRYALEHDQQSCKVGYKVGLLKMYTSMQRPTKKGKKKKEEEPEQISQMLTQYASELNPTQESQPLALSQQDLSCNTAYFKEVHIKCENVSKELLE